MVYYSGHGKLLNGTQRVSLVEDKRFPLETKIRNFKNKHSKNAYVLGIFDSCRITNAETEKEGLVLAEEHQNKSIGKSSLSMGHQLLSLRYCFLVNCD
jgi:hypothetical protein